MKRLALLAALTVATVAHAQSAPAKKELVNKLLTLQRPGLEAMAQGMAERPAVEVMQRAHAALRTAPADKQQAAAANIEADLKKYADESGGFLKDRAVKLAPTTVGPILEEKLSEEDLRQVIAWMESPVRKKYEALWPEMQNAMAQKLVADGAPTLDPKIKALQQKVGNTLRTAGANIEPDPAAKPAAAPKNTGTGK